MSAPHSRCDRHVHSDDARPIAALVLTCAGCGIVIARCAACEDSYPPGNALSTMRAHLRNTMCLSRSAVAQKARA